MLLQKRKQWKQKALQNTLFKINTVLNTMQIIWENMQISQKKDETGIFTVTGFIMTLKNKFFVN